MSWLEIITLALLPAFLLLDLIHPPRGERNRWWRSRAFAVSAFNFMLAMTIGQAYGAAFGDFHIFNGAALGTVGGALVGILVYELFHYTYHRAAHRYDGLWRMGHQMHHSAESLDAWGAYFLHPLDAAVFTTLSSLVLFPLLGLSPVAGGLAAAFITFCGVFQHANLKTPRWVGYLVQRPESHAVHHERGVHAYNYSDLPLWDMVFGTFRNPAADRPLPQQGFYDGASARLLDMLLFRDVSLPRGGAGSAAPVRDSGGA